MSWTRRYRAYPLTDEVEADARYQIDLNREVYNHALTQHYNPAPEHDTPSYTTLQNKLPEWKREFPTWKEAHSKALQMAVRRIYWAQDALDALKERGFNVGDLKWKSPHEFRSVTYNQSGFDVDSNTGRSGHATLWLSKIGTFDLEYHRPLPDDANITQVVLKREKTSKWFVSIVLETEPDYPDPPDPSGIDVEETVGIDLGIRSFTHDSDGVGVTPPDFTDDLRRIDTRHRELSRKDHGSNNWEKARRRLAEAYEDIRNRFKDFREKLARAYTQEYDAVFLEELNTRGLLSLQVTGRNVALMSWSETIQTFERHGRKNGCHVLTVPPAGTTKRCANCDVESEKPLWVREHSCPACGFEADRDANAAYNIQKLGLEELGVEFSLHELGLGETESMWFENRRFSPSRKALPFERPAETVTAAGTVTVPASHVVETGSLPSREAGCPAPPRAG